MIACFVLFVFVAPASSKNLGTENLESFDLVWFRDNSIEKTLNPSKNPYEKPVVVLIDVTSMSCSEHFAACLQVIGRAVVVGERSPGYLLGAKWIKLPNGLSFMHTALQPIPFGGRIVEGNGVKPDIDIMLNRNGLLMGRDNQLEAAIAYILKK